MSEQTDASINKQINDLKVNELKIELEKRCLDKSGVKAVLIERLEKALINEGYDPETYVFFQNNSSTTIANSSSNTQSLTTENENDNNSTTICLNENKDDSIENCNLIIDENSEKSSVIKDILIDDVNDLITTTTSDIIDSKESDTSNDFIQKNEKSSLEIINITDNNEEGKKKSPTCSNESTNKETLKVTEKTKLIQKATTEQDLAASVWIRGITSTTKAADLKILFSKYGDVLAAKIFTTKNKLSPTFFGYITMVNAASANICIQKLNRTNLKGKVITVEKANRSLLPQLNKAAAAATTTITTATTITSSNNKSITPVIANKKIEPEDSKKSTSPEIIHISPPASKKNLNDSRVSKEEIKNNKNVNFSDSSKKTENIEKVKSSTNHPRIISTKSTSSSKSKLRKIEPPTHHNERSITRKHSNRTLKTISRYLDTSNRGRASFHLSSSSHLNSSNSRSVKSSMNSKSINNRIYISSRRMALNRSSASNIKRRAVIRRNQNFSRLSSRLVRRSRSPITKSSYEHSYSTQKASKHYSNNSIKMSSWERNEMIRLMRKKEEEYRKKEEELKFQRERERMRFERERLEKEKLEVQQMKLTAQLASAQMAFLPQSSHQSLAVVVPDIKSTSIDRNRSSKTSKRSISRERRSSQHHNSTSSNSNKKKRHTRSKSRSPSCLTYKKSNNSKHDDYRNDKTRYRASLSHNKTSSVNNRYEKVESFTSHNKSSYGQSYNNNNNSHSSRYYNLNHNIDSNINKSFSKPNNMYVDSRSKLGSSGRVSSLNRSSPNRKLRQDSYLAASDSYNQQSSRILNDDISSASYTRTDPSYASRIASTNITNNSNISGVGVDEMFGSSSSNNYYNSNGASSNSRNESNFTSRIGNGNFRNNLMSYHHSTINDDNNHWNSSNRNEYSDCNLLSGSNNWSSGNVGGGSSDLFNSSNRSTNWYSGFPPNNNQKNLNTNRYSNSCQNSSRRY